MSAQGTNPKAEEAFGYESYRKLYSIPQREIDVIEGYLKQNPDY